jgi:hypothetical protein
MFSWLEPIVLCLTIEQVVNVSSSAGSIFVLHVAIWGIDCTDSSGSWLSLIWGVDVQVKIVFYFLFISSPKYFLCLFAESFMYIYILLVPKLSKWMFMTFSDCVNFYPFISQVIK